MRDDELTVQIEMLGCGRAGLESCEVIPVGDFVNCNRDGRNSLQQPLTTGGTKNGYEDQETGR